MALDLTRLKEYITSRAYEIFYDSLPETDEPWRQFCEIKEDTSRILVQTDSLTYAGELSPWEEGDALVYEEPVDGYTVYGRVRFFRKGRKIGWHARQIGDVVNELLDQIRNWSEAVVYTRNKWIRTMLENGALTAGHTSFDQSINGTGGVVFSDPTGGFIYDGKPLFADDQTAAGGTDNRHPAKFNATVLFTNYQALPLTYDNLITVYNAMKSNNIDDYGRKMDIQPDILLVPTNLETVAEQLTMSEKVPSDTGTPSKPNPLYGKVKPVVWNELNTTDGWILIDSRLKGMVVFDNMQDIDINVWIDNDTRELRCDITAKFGAFIRNWRAFYGCNLPQV